MHESENQQLQYILVTSKIQPSRSLIRIRLLNVMNFLKMSFVRYECLKYVFCTLWMSQRFLLYKQIFILHYIMDVSKTSFVRYDRSKISFVCYEFLKDVFCMLQMSQTYLFAPFRMSQRCLLYVMDVSKMSFVRYGCPKDLFCTLRYLNVNISYMCFENIFCTDL